MERERGLQVVQSKKAGAVSGENHIRKRICARKHQIALFILWVWKDHSNTNNYQSLFKSKRKFPRRSTIIEQLWHGTLLSLAIFANKLEWGSLPLLHNNASNSNLEITTSSHPSTSPLETMTVPAPFCLCPFAFLSSVIKQTNKPYWFYRLRLLISISPLRYVGWFTFSFLILFHHPIFRKE